MIAPQQRREFIDWNLLYLFSYDVELDLQGQEKLGRFPEGVRMNCFARRDLSRVYNVGRESTVPGYGRPAGSRGARRHLSDPGI